MTTGTQGPDQTGPVDDGLQIERTILAWKRSLLSGIVLLIAVMKVGVCVSLGWTLALVAGAMLVAGSVSVVVTRSYRGTARRFRSIGAAASAPSSSDTDPGAPFGLLGPIWTLMTAVTISLCAIALLAVFITDGPAST